MSFADPLLYYHRRFLLEAKATPSTCRAGGLFFCHTKKLDKQQASQPVILSSHCFRRTINPPMNIHSILYAIFYVNLDLTQFSFKNVISSVCSCTLRISFIFIYTQHIFDIIRHLPRHLKLLRNTGMPRCSHTISAEQKM